MMSLMLICTMYLSCIDLCSDFRMLKTRRRGPWYSSPFLISLWVSIPFICTYTPITLALFLTFSEVNDYSLSNLMISGNPMGTEVQQSINPLHMCFVDLNFIIMTFWKFFNESTTWSTGFLLTHIRSIQTSLLKIMSLDEIVALNGSGESKKVEHNVQLWETFSSFLYYGSGFFTISSMEKAVEFSCIYVHEMLVCFMKFLFFSRKLKEFYLVGHIHVSLRSLFLFSIVVCSISDIYPLSQWKVQILV